MRKTISVEDIRSQVNQMLANSTCEPDVRNGMILVLEDVLHKTGNYNGFMYLTVDEVPKGETPGVNINFNTLNPVSGLPEHDFINTDDSRRRYF